MSSLRYLIGLLSADTADVEVQQVWSQYRACCGQVMTGSTVLEVGCGLGEHSMELLEFGHAKWYAGLDLSTGLIKNAKLQYKSLDFLAGDGCLLPFADSSFDVVTSSFIFHHVPVSLREKALREQLRVGKVALLRDLFGMERGWRSWLYRLYYRVFDGSEYRFTLVEWRRFIESAGGHILFESHVPENMIRNRHCFFLIG